MAKCCIYSVQHGGHALAASGLLPRLSYLLSVSPCLCVCKLQSQSGRKLQQDDSGQDYQPDSEATSDSEATTAYLADPQRRRQSGAPTTYIQGAETSYDPASVLNSQDFRDAMNGVVSGYRLKMQSLSE